MTDVPKTHPRYLSLKTREKIVQGVESGITSIHGLIAHGRGEAFDYMIGEKTNDFATEAIHAAAVILLLAEKPVISVNGNAAALAGKELVKLGKAASAKLEVNIFHASKEREKKIKKHLIENGATEVLMPGDGRIKFIESNRRFCSKEGIESADVVFVPLEDGDRCEALIKEGKRVITVDLNPLSRTARCASITIVDNITRCLSLLTLKVNQLKAENNANLKGITGRYDNHKTIMRAIKRIREFR